MIKIVINKYLRRHIIQEKMATQKSYNITPCMKEFQGCLEDAINQISYAISLVLQKIDLIYKSLSIGFLLEIQYIHKLIMSIVCPVDLRIQYDLQKTYYFTKTIAANTLFTNTKTENKEQRKGKGQSRLQDESEEATGKKLIKNEFRQDLMNMQKSKSQAKQRLKMKLKQKLQKKPDLQQQNPQAQQNNNTPYPLPAQKDPLTQSQKYRKISEWIIQQTENGKKIQLTKLIQKITTFNNDSDPYNARKWFKIFLERTPEIKDRLTFNGNHHLMNIKVKGQMGVMDIEDGYHSGEFQRSSGYRRQGGIFQS